MSVCMSYKSVTHLCRRSLKKLVTRTITLAYSSNHAQESISRAVPASETGKIYAAVLRKFSDAISVESIEPPKNVQNNEVLVDVHNCAVNPSDVLLSRNAYRFEPTLPMVLGYEIVGRVVQVGDEAQKSGYRVGDKVVALNKDRYGGLAERCIAEIGNVWKIPESIKSVDAVCLLDNYVTALIALEQTVALEEDDMILINVGISGHGLAAVDIAANIFRAKVIGICATEHGTDLVRDKGAYASLKYKDKQLLRQIEDIAAERNIKAVFDGESGEYLKKILNSFTKIYADEKSLNNSFRDDNFAVVMHHLSREGRVIIAGAASTTREDDAKEKDTFTLSGFDLQQFKKKNPEVYRQAGEEVLQFFEEGLITPTRSLITGLNRINDALNFTTKTKCSGKVVIDIRNKDAETSATKT